MKDTPPKLRTKPDPRVIFALVFATSSFAILIREDVVAMVGLLVLVLICTFLLNVKLRRVFSRLKLLIQILIVIALLRSLFAPAGVVLLSAWDIPLLTTGGLAMGILVALRLIIFIIGASMFTVYPVRGLIQSMVQMKMPYEIAYMVSIGVRFVPQLSEELKDSLTALQLRGVVIEEMKLHKRLSLYTYLLLPAIVSSLQQAKELAMSMEMRAFRAMSRRTSYFKLTFDKWDTILILGILFFSVVIGFVVFSYDFYSMIMSYLGVY